nr:uncharacterized protein LOC106682130 isoform X3 [Halyomorpha halys]
MKLIRTYHIFYTQIAMGYSRSFIIASVVGLIGIGICFIIEKKWKRNIDRAPSDRRLAQSAGAEVRTPASEMATNIPSECLPPSVSPKLENSVNESLNTYSPTEGEDDVTFLFGPLSCMSIHDKSSSGLPVMTYTLRQDDMLTILEEMIERIESRKTNGSELQSDKSTVFSRIKKTLEHVKSDISKSNIAVVQPNEETREGTEDPLISISTLKMEEVDMSNTNSREEVINDTVREANDEPDSCGPNIIDHLTETEQRTFHDDTQSDKSQYRNDNESPILLGHYIPDNDQSIDCKNNIVDEKSGFLLSNYRERSCTVIHQQECVAPNVDKELSGILKEEYVQIHGNPSPFAQEDCLSDGHLELQISNSQDINGTDDGNNDVMLSGVGDGVSLEEAYSSMSSVSPTSRDVPRESSLEVVNRENTKCDIKNLDNRPTTLSILQYTDLAAVPTKAKIKAVEDFSGSKEVKISRIRVDCNGNETQKFPQNNAKHRVQRLLVVILSLILVLGSILVGFFENKVEKK